MDGNGRWAQAKGMFRTAGHRSGMECRAQQLSNPRAHSNCLNLTIFGFPLKIGAVRLKKSRS